MVQQNENKFQKVCTYEIQLSRREGWDSINRFNCATFLCLSQARTWIFNVMCHGLFFVYSGLMWEMIVHFVDIDGIVYIHSLDFLFNTLAADFNCNA
jgi:hypothetical protein